METTSMSRPRRVRASPGERPWGAGSPAEFEGRSGSVIPRSKIGGLMGAVATGSGGGAVAMHSEKERLKRWMSRQRQWGRQGARQVQEKERVQGPEHVADQGPGGETGSATRD